MTTQLEILLPAPTKDKGRWHIWGVKDNPFPESGVAHGVDYTAHLTDGQIEDINQWLGETLTPEQSQWRPLAIKGSIGVGKTHWLQSIERLVLRRIEEHGLEESIHISRHPLTGAGMAKLNLGSLLHEGLSSSDIVARSLRAYRAGPTAHISTSSPLHAPLSKLRNAQEQDVDELIDLFDSWLQRSKLSPTKLARLGVHDHLETEGQWVRAQAHVCKLAAQVSGFQVWIVLLDQLEDLWRRDVTTPLRRARFLSDLRTLIDEAYEGAPIAVAMAWNTAAAGDTKAPPDVERQLRKDYQALFTRIHGDRVISFPRLPREHALPFARAYVEHAKLGGREHEERSERLLKRLEHDLNQLLEQADGDVEVSPRRWLQVLHQWAADLPTPSERPRGARLPAKRPRP
jgi:hypothetical protein